MIKPVNHIIFLTVLALALVACNADVLKPLPTSSPTPLPNNDELKNLDGPVLVLQQSGGITGVTYQWALYADGRIESTKGSFHEATLEQVDQLLSKIEQLGYFELSSRYMPLYSCCDRILYELSVGSDGREHSLTVLDATPDVPETVWEVLYTVSDFFEAHGK